MNLGAIVAGFLVVTYAFQPKTIVLMFIAIVRTIIDYGLCWDFYFPNLLN